MKSTLLFTVAALIAAIPALAADGVTGKWVIHQSVAGNENDANCTFAQTGEELTGSCDFPGGAVKLAGKIAQKKVAFTIQTEYNGAPLTLRFSGTVESATKMSGNVAVEPFGVEGDWTAAPAK